MILVILLTPSLNFASSPCGEETVNINLSISEAKETTRSSETSLNGLLCVSKVGTYMYLHHN